MNIQEAKVQIERAVKIYLTKDKNGNYRIPVRQQRPVYLLGSPGIGKTAIVEQIAEEMDIALVSYSMTHHTRQSALGLPFIVHKEFDGHAFDISEYTMSEIVASVYETMEASGKREGILFLDEINCVSETLAPSMLQFLQYKTFGRHRIPDGWVIVTAGNPPQYNRSVREFDVVTLDRLKLLEVDAAYEPWRAYGINKGLHGAVLSYLDIRKSDFYTIENTPEGRAYVTARGWEDLSEALYLYEENDFPVDETLVEQYLHHRRISREFSTYYDLYSKYRKEYSIEQILAGKAGKDVLRRAGRAGFDERLSLMSLLFTAEREKISAFLREEEKLQDLMYVLRDVKRSFKKAAVGSKESLSSALVKKNGNEILEEKIRTLAGAMEQKAGGNVLDAAERDRTEGVIRTLEGYRKGLRSGEAGSLDDAFDVIAEDFKKKTEALKVWQTQIGQELEHLFSFTEDAFGEGNEMLLLVTDLTTNYDCARYLNGKGCKPYFKYSRKFRVSEREQEIDKQMERLEL